jgi:cytochrome c biogenesis factor
MRHGGLPRPSLNYRKRRIERIGEKETCMLLGMILVTLAALVLLVGTVTFLWEVLKKISSDDVKSFRFFLTFVVVFVPLFILISFGGLP